MLSQGKIIVLQRKPLYRGAVQTKTPIQNIPSGSALKTESVDHDQRDRARILEENREIIGYLREWGY